ncbi:multidrug efflux system membrane fusion protein [Haloferula luteola]|uniref:Multidrug efflux system membrane fusion protein n=1 Tax=Haloferula luteola TaxID=595692 RepID=A0A840VBM8_9BACT|nr:efflux RND transporter periplasmic adaptor subunit [Haloferula luteola]MBB5350291.1 multidrug efflux system membrane fusion protein [Haloferula luteola]
MYSHALTTSLVLTLALGACRKNDGPAPQQQAPVVEFVQPTQETITSWDEYNGRLEAIDSVEVRARVGGMLEKIHFTDGQTVEEGDLLFTIDPKPFEAALKAARAELDQASASETLAKQNYERGQQLLDRNAIAREEVDIRQGSLAEAQARTSAAEAQVETAELNLGYTQVRSPIHGRIADRFITPGNLISGGSAESTLLTTIVSIDPIYCRIDADEATVLKYLRLQKEGKRESARNSRVPVEMAVDGDEGYPRGGYIDFVSNAFDPATATLRARALFENGDSFLAPGMFAKLRLPGRGEYTATLVPEIAIQTQQDITYLLTLNSENIVQSTAVTLGPKHGDLRVIESDLPLDTRVLVSGITMARPGMPTSPKPAETKAPNAPETQGH